MDPPGVNAFGDNNAGGRDRREGSNGGSDDNDANCPDNDSNNSIQEDDRGYDRGMVCLADY